MTLPTLDTALRGIGNASAPVVSSTPIPADNAAVAGNVADLFRAVCSGEAVKSRLDAARQGQPQAVQDALDRMVSTRLQGSLDPSPSLGLQSMYASPAEIGSTIRRINEAGSHPPSMPDTANLSDQQKYDVYSSIVETRGTQASHDALEAGDRVILGLRNETNTLANKGQGVDDDRLVVLARDTDGTAHAQEFNRTSTEPTAQYDGNQSANPDVTFRRSEGDDITGDGVPELGRLAQGTTELIETTHANPRSAGTSFSLRPSAAAVADGAGRVERDANHDGLFNADDVNGAVDPTQHLQDPLRQPHEYRFGRLHDPASGRLRFVPERGEGRCLADALAVRAHHHAVAAERPRVRSPRSPPPPPSSSLPRPRRPRAAATSRFPPRRPPARSKAGPSTAIRADSTCAPHRRRRRACSARRRR